ncbi:MAG: hypothetical protein ACREYB_02180 [Casimicrobiaceae bacterium]
MEYGATIRFGPSKKRAAELPLTGAQFVVEHGSDPSVLVVAFTGFAGRLSIPTFDFMRCTELLNYNRILLCDNSRTCYLNGIPPIAEDVDALLALLRKHVEQLAPKQTIFIGGSGGSHAAILFGHLLAADFVQAFSPHTNVDPVYWRESEFSKDIEAFSTALDRLDRVPAKARSYFDLRQVLRQSNGRTRYNLHVCARSAPDLTRALHLEGLPSVTIHRHDCDNHAVAVWLARRRRLLPLFDLGKQGELAAAAGDVRPAV